MQININLGDSWMDVAVQFLIPLVALVATFIFFGVAFRIALYLNKRKHKTPQK